MIAEERAEPDDAFFLLLAEFDEALAAGVAPPLLDGASTEPHLQGRLHQGLACMHLVRRCLSPGRPADSVQANGGEAERNNGADFEKLGRFEIRRELGRGTYGIVFLAYDPRLCREVALKVPRMETLVTAEVRARFLREASAAAGLDHPNLLAVYEADQIGPICYITSAYCPGMTLETWLRQRAKPMPVRQAARLSAVLAAAVQHAHARGVLHRDLKPSNILLDMQADSGSSNGKDEASDTLGFIPKVTDFGLAKMFLEEDAGQTESGTILGTPSYMAPEQAAGKTRAISTASDVYALGAILYELLTGQPPFRGANVADTLEQVRSREPAAPSRLARGVPRDLDTLCLKCLQKDPVRRYASAQELADELERFLSDRPIQARRISIPARLWRWCRRNPALAGALGLAAACLAAVVILAVGSAIQQARALKESQKLSATLAFEQGLTLCEQGDTSRGMLWLARALQMAPQDAADLRRVIRVNLGAWGQQITPLQAILPHADPVQSFAVSSDGATVVTIANNKAAFVWKTAGPTLVGEAFRHDEDYLTAVACSPRGGAVLTGGSRIFRPGQATVRLWDLETRTPLGPSLVQGGAVHAAAISPDGQRLLTGAHGKCAHLWDVATNKSVALPHGDYVRAVAFSAEGNVCGTGSWDKTACLWETSTGKLRGEPLLHPDGIVAVAFSPDSRLFVTGCNDGKVRLWEIATGKPAGAPLVHQGVVSSIAFSADGHTLLTGCFDGQARLWDLRTGRSLPALLTHQGEVTAVAFNPDGKSVWTASNDRLVRNWRLPARPSAKRILEHKNVVTDVAFSPDGAIMVSASQDRTARIWEVASGKLRHVLPHPHRVANVAFSPDGKTVLTGADDGVARLWDAATGQCLLDKMKHAVNPIFVIAFSPTGRTVLTAGRDNMVRLWDAATGNAWAAPLKHEGRVRGVACSPDGQTVLTGSDDRTARLWETATGKPIGAPMDHQAPVGVVAFSPQGKQVCTGSGDGTVRLWDATTGKMLVGPLRHQGYINTASFSPDGTLLATAGQDRVVRLWDTATGKAAGFPLTHEGRIYSVAFSPDGSMLLTGSHDKTARLWDTATGRAIGPPLQHLGFVVRAVFSPDGRSVLTACEDSSARLWDVPAPMNDEVGHIIKRLEVSTGLELRADGGVWALDLEAWQQRKREVSE